MKDPQAWTTGWGWTVGAGGGIRWAKGAKGENWDNCNRITIIKKEEEKKPQIRQTAKSRNLQINVLLLNDL